VGDGADSTRNAQHGTADNVVQARDIHGDVHVTGRNNREWLVPAAVVIASVLVGVLIVVLPGRGPASGGQAPAELRVTTDLSANDVGPWGYVSGSSDFPSAKIVERLSHPMAATDTAIKRDVRTTGAASLQHQLIRLHLEGPKEGEVTVTDIRPVIRTKQAPLNGSLVWAPPQGEENSSEVLLELDDAFPVVQASAYDQSHRQRVPTGPFFPANTIKLSDGETHEVIITAETAEYSYEYELAVIYQSGAEIKQVIVNDAGRTFRVSGMSCSGAHIASYRSAYVLVGDFSVVAEQHPDHFDVRPHC
jgi:hypothetical protein